MRSGNGIQVCVGRSNCVSRRRTFEWGLAFSPRDPAQDSAPKPRATSPRNVRRRDTSAHAAIVPTCGSPVIGATLWRSIVREMHRVGVLVMSGAAVVLAVNACSGSGSGSGSGGSAVDAAVVAHVRGLPPGISEPPAGAAAPGVLKPFATWAESHEIYVTTWGSSSCPKLPTSVHAKGAHRVQISTAGISLHSGDNACTNDLAPTTSTVRLPAAISDTAALVVTIDGTPTELGPRAR